MAACPSPAALRHAATRSEGGGEPSPAWQDMTKHKETFLKTANIVMARALMLLSCGFS